MVVKAVAQEAPSGPQSLIATVLAADGERTRLLAEAEHAEDPHRIGEIHEGLAAMAISGFDMACWDALAQAAGLPLATLLGAAPGPIRASRIRN